MQQNPNISRREFLKIAGLALTGLAFRPWRLTRAVEDFPDHPSLGRVTEGKVAIRALPDINSAEVGALYEDAVVPRLREVVGYNPYRNSQRWVETPDGYVWSPLLQPVKDDPQTPQRELHDTSIGPGMWVQVSVPYVDVVLERSAPIAPSVKLRVEQGLLPRLYYSQVIWCDDIQTDSDGQVWYRLNERFGFGDIFWGRAEAFRTLTFEEVAPINPEVENKRVVVNVARQILSCYEGDREVYFARCSTGKVGEEFETPFGENYFVWRKMISTHMIGGTTGGGYDLVGVGFTTLFQGDGIAIHSTFWHNNYGERTSHGCINVRPEDAQWVFRWCSPYVNYDPGDVTVTDYSGTNIQVYES